MRIGTSHFVSRERALQYYDRLSFANRVTLREIEAKITAGEIHIGPPKLQEGEHLSVIDNGCRYAIITREP